MDSRLAALIDKHGVFTRKEAIELGYRDQAIASLVRQGRWIRVRRGAYVFCDGWASLTASERYGVLCRAALRQARADVLLSHVSAANEYAAPLWDLPKDAVHLTRKDRRAGRREAGITQHRGQLLPEDMAMRNGVPVVSATRAALEVTTMMDVEHALVIIDHLLHEEHTTLEAIRKRYELMNHWPETLRTDLVLRLADGRSESVGETRTRYLCWSQHLPAPEVNYPILDEEGRQIARVDLAWPDLGVFLEFDGKVKYQRYLKEGDTVTDCVVREKERESLICELTGWRCVRLVWADLDQPKKVADRIRRLFRTAAA